MSEPDNRDFSHGLRLRELGRDQEAIPFFYKALAPDPNRADVHHELAGCLRRLGEIERALEHIEQALGIAPEDAHHHLRKSYVLSARNDPHAALRSAKNALALEPEWAQCHVGISSAFLDLEQWREAESAAREALSLDARNEYALSYLGIALRELGRLDESQQIIDQLLTQDPENQYTHAEAGKIALLQLQRKAAEAHLRDALRIDPQFRGAREDLLESFRQRSLSYRCHSAYMQWLDGLKIPLFVLVGIALVAFGIIGRLLEKFDERLPQRVILLVAGFVILLWFSRQLGNLMILCDRSVRILLSQRERLEAIFTAGAAVTGTMVFGIGIIIDSWAVLLAAVTLIAGAVPAAGVFSKDRSKATAYFCGATLIYTYVAGFGSAILIAYKHSFFNLPLYACSVAAILILIAFGAVRSSA